MTQTLANETRRKQNESSRKLKFAAQFKRLRESIDRIDNNLDYHDAGKIDLRDELEFASQVLYGIRILLTELPARTEGAARK